MKIPKDLITIKKAAQMLQVTEKQIKEKINNNKIVYIKLGNIYYVSKKSIMYYMKFKKILN